jgi:hypothetical protein
VKTYQNLLKSVLIAGFSLSLLACGSSSEIAAPAEALVAPAPAPEPISPSDHEPPVIELMGESLYSLALGQPFEDPGAKAIDDVDGEVPVTVNRPTLSNIGKYAVVYSAKDVAGNESSVERTIIVNDVVAPVISLNGPQSMNLGFGDPYSEQGATATDDVDGNVEVTINGSIGEGIGSYTIIYSALDKSGNQSSSNRTVVVEDLLAPVITLNGLQSMNLGFGEPYSEQGATAIDDVDGNVGVTINGSIGEGIGSYTIIYSAVDNSGNQSSTNRTVVVEDLVGPVIILNGPQSMNLGFGEPYSEEGATATDDVDGNVEVTINGSIGEGIGSYIIIYSAVDKSGNQSSTNRTVVVEDLVGPVITLNGAANINLEFGKSYDEQGATATDDVDGELEVTVEGSVGEDVGIYIISYLATDNAGNESIIERRVKVEKFLFEADIAKDILQSTPTDATIPLGLQATMDIEYLGAFRVEANGESNSNFAVATLGFNPDNNSLFMAGNTQNNAIAEFEIPDELSMEETVGNIIKANVFQDYVTVLDKLEVGSQNNKITGLLYFNESLLVSSERWYDASASNMDNLQVFSKAADINSSPFNGMLQLQGGAKAAGYMSKVPSELVESLGTEYIVGWASNYSITGRYSQGPSLYSFTPESAINAVITVDRKINTEALMVFPAESGKELVDGGTEYKQQIDPIWSPLAKAKYGFIVPGTSIFMAIGYNGGIHSGTGYKITQDNGNVCAGGCAYGHDDYYNFFWLFDINEMLEAEQPWMVRPISYGKWSHPYDSGGSKAVNGATFDHNTSTLYLSLNGAGKAGNYDFPPLIVAYKVEAKN